MVNGGLWVTERLADVQALGEGRGAHANKTAKELPEVMDSKDRVDTKLKEESRRKKDFSLGPTPQESDKDRHLTGTLDPPTHPRRDSRAR